MSVYNWTPSPGQIIRAEVPFADVEQTRTRFPVVVSNSAFNTQNPELIVAFATRSSNIKHPRSYDVEISSKHPDFRLTGLTESTTVRCGRLFTLSKGVVSDVIGQVPDDLWIDVQHLVRACF